MRKMLPILAGFLVMGCSLPKTHDPNLARFRKVLRQPSICGNLPQSTAFECRAWIRR